jgi:hypothetical protein
LTARDETSARPAQGLAVRDGSQDAAFLQRFVDDEELVPTGPLARRGVRGLARPGNPRRAEERACTLAERLGVALPLYIRFFRADNATEGKSPQAVRWFERVVRGARAGPAESQLCETPLSGTGAAVPET